MREHTAAMPSLIRICWKSHLQRAVSKGMEEASPGVSFPVSIPYIRNPVRKGKARMRNIIIVRGPQGTGKSGFIRKLGLEGHHLSFDKMREAVSGDTVAISGEMGIPQEHNQLVGALVFESLERRMKGGETIAFEATLPLAREVAAITSIAVEHRYEILVVDFYDVPVDQAVAANAMRPERIRVPEFAVRRCYEQAASQPLPADIRTVRVSSMDATDQPAAEVMAFLTRQTQIRDVSSYARIVHVGDLQGTLHPLMAPESPLHGGFRDDTLYVFCGDLLDRGVENGDVLRWWIDNAMHRENVLITAGNHEDHLEIHAAGKPAVSREFRDHTLPQIEAAGISREDIAAVAARTLPLFMYRWHGQQVLVTHGGLSRWPSQPHLIPEAILRKGNGHYGHGIDTMWVEAERDSGLIQVHGHRNSRLLPVLAAEAGSAKSFNLEGQVEFGGHMRLAVLDHEGWHTIQIRSREFRTMQQARAIDNAAGRKTFDDQAPITPWAARGDDDLTPLSDEMLEQFQNHRMVVVNQQDSMPHVSSIGFTKSAFYSKTWDQFTTVARGLFIDNIDNSVVARSYEKFFNHGERPETQDAGLQERIVFPVDGFDKLNGFLCITGYSERTGQLIVASKSRVDGPFAEMAQDLVAKKLGAAGMERLLRFNRDQKASCIFEAIDMGSDPHIIDYAEDRLVLIGCVRRHETFEQVDYDTLVGIAKWLGCEVKERLFPRIRDWRALSAIMERVENDPKWRRDNPTEGIVFQDSSGNGVGADFQWKSKAWFYRNLKRCRSGVERIALCRRKDAEFDRERYEDMPQEFRDLLDWAQTLPNEALEIGIIALHKMFKGDRSKAEAMGSAPAPKAKDMSGYVRALEAMAIQITNGTAKPESVRRMVEAAQGDDDKRMALDGCEAGDVLKAFVAKMHRDMSVSIYLRIANRTGG